MGLLKQLGYRRPTARELAGVVARLSAGRLPIDKQKPDDSLMAVAISGDPPVTFSGITPWARFGLASRVGQKLGRRPAWFLLSPTWSVETERLAILHRRYAVLHRLAHPNHRLVLWANTEGEAALHRTHREAAFHMNKACAVSETVFRPLEGVPVEFDAIYNAQLTAFKRHELSGQIERCAFVCYWVPYLDHTEEEARGILRQHAQAAPGHVFVNEFDAEGLPVRLSPEEVNRQLARAAVGLALSEIEGVMLANTEYLLAGLPVVTTPSLGGRSHYHDPEYCLRVAPEPRAVAEAVAALKARRIPREYIRRKTLERIERDRSRFVDAINAVLEEAGADARMAAGDFFNRPVPYPWMPAREAVRRAVRGEPDIGLSGRSTAAGGAGAAA